MIQLQLVKYAKNAFVYQDDADLTTCRVKNCNFFSPSFCFALRAAWVLSHFMAGKNTGCANYVPNGFVYENVRANVSTQTVLPQKNCC
jgi:hypothetical protein